MLLCSTARLKEECVGARRVSEGLIDSSGEETLETTKSLAVGETVLLAAVHVGFGGLVGTALGHGGAMDYSIEFAVAEPTEPVAGLASGGSLDWRGAAIGGEMGLGAECALTNKADDLTGRRRAEPVNGDEQ